MSGNKDSDPLLKSTETFVRKWFEGFHQQGLFGTLFQLLHKMAPWVFSVIPIETIGSQDIPSTDRRVRYAKKQLRMVARFLFAFVPSRFQQVLGYFLGDIMEGNISQEVGKLPVNPSPQGSKKKQPDLGQEVKPDLGQEVKPDLGQEAEQSWVKAIQGALPDEDDPEDSTYEPTVSESETDEYESQNDIETDLEIDEKNGLVTLKEQPTQQVAQNGAAEAREPEGRESRSSGDGSEHPDNTAASSSGQDETLTGQAAGMATPNQEVMGNRPAPEGPALVLSSDSQEQWEFFRTLLAHCYAGGLNCDVAAGKWLIMHLPYYLKAPRLYQQN
uniref:Uncharacterized protein n=1 Tax=Sphaerodactylus townsendi TaxID=933632 RepID=A0ACB8F1B5_9SAUR